MTGVELISAERDRQQRVEEFDLLHDDEHVMGELASAAMCYTEQAIDADISSGEDSYRFIKEWWPWDDSWWKPSSDPIRNLIKAGALIAAEIDRLQRQARSAEIDKEIREAVQRDKVREAHRILEKDGENHVPTDK